MTLPRADLPGADPDEFEEPTAATMIRTAAFVGGVFSLAACAFALMLLTLAPLMKPDQASHMGPPARSVVSSPL